MGTTRRRFLRLLGLGAATGTAVAVGVRGQEQPKPQPVYRINYPGPYEDEGGRRYIYMRADRDLCAGEPVYHDEDFVGVVVFPIAQGEYGFVQTQGELL